MTAARDRRILLASAAEEKGMMRAKAAAAFSVVLFALAAEVQQAPASVLSAADRNANVMSPLGKWKSCTEREVARQ